MQNTTLTVAQRPIAELRPYSKNARTHSAAQVEQIARSIKRFGFTNPVLIGPDGTIIAGHGRVLAATLLGWSTVPVIELAHLKPDEVRAYVIADNKLAELAGWDDDLLRLELGDLLGAGFDMDATGFAGDELDAILGNALATGGGIEAPPFGSYSEQYGVIVICADEPEQRRVYDDLRDRGMNCRVVAR